MFINRLKTIKKIVIIRSSMYLPHFAQTFSLKPLRSSQFSFRTQRLHNPLSRLDDFVPFTLSIFELNLPLLCGSGQVDSFSLQNLEPSPFLLCKSNTLPSQVDSPDSSFEAKDIPERSCPVASSRSSLALLVFTCIKDHCSE